MDARRVLALDTSAGIAVQRACYGVRSHLFSYRTILCSLSETLSHRQCFV